VTATDDGMYGPDGMVNTDGMLVRVAETVESGGAYENGTNVDGAAPDWKFGIMVSGKVDGIL